MSPPPPLPLVAREERYIASYLLRFMRHTMTFATCSRALLRARLLCNRCTWKSLAANELREHALEPLLPSRKSAPNDLRPSLGVASSAPNLRVRFLKISQIFSIFLRTWPCHLVKFCWQIVHDHKKLTRMPLQNNFPWRRR